MVLKASEDKIVLWFTDRKCDLDSALKAGSRRLLDSVHYLHSRIPTYRRYNKHLKVMDLTVSRAKH